MGVEFGEARSCRRMAFLAGLQYVFLRYRRIRAVDLLNVVRAVAIRTLCHSGVPESRHFPVIRFAVRFYFFGMAGPALFDQIQLPIVACGGRRQVFHMTLKAGRRCRVIILQELLSMYAGFINLELLRMALGAEGRDLLPIRGRPRVRGGVDIMIAMTGLAGRYHGLSHGIDLVMHTQLELLGLLFGRAFRADEMTGPAVDFRDVLPMGISGYIVVALVTGQMPVRGLLKGGYVYVPGHAFLPMAIKTGVLGSSRRREQKIRNNEEQGEVFHECVIHDYILAKNHGLSRRLQIFFEIKFIVIAMRRFFRTEWTRAD